MTAFSTSAATLSPTPPPARIPDLGSGPGSGSLALALARQFPAAQVTAVGISPQLLHRPHEQAAAHGVADRISTLEANIDDPWTEIGEGGPYDLIRAAAFLHHVADPARTFAQAFERLRPGGLIAVTEMDFPPAPAPSGSPAAHDPRGAPRPVPAHPLSPPLLRSRRRRPALTTASAGGFSHVWHSCEIEHFQEPYAGTATPA
ncbi:class I SAM-dependent methyltransferase [Streptomyces sp. NPDC058812]|uniref:class I SAM-dependent methyltransferase n=1 Tax=unclassified Streptomyces TaxID=2593676 RepID=UPI003699D165